jgi:hypothetical protein
LIFLDNLCQEKNYQESPQGDFGSFRQDFKEEKTTKKAPKAILVAFVRISKKKKLPRKPQRRFW